jgi:muconolactone delta-isomerase
LTATVRDEAPDLDNTGRIKETVMRFLIVTKTRYPLPLEMAAGLIDAMSAWVEQNTTSGKIEQTWSFAGTAGGGGILNVGSLEELDAVMIGFPFGQFSEIEVYPLADLAASLQQQKALVQAMGGGA